MPTAAEIAVAVRPSLARSTMRALQTTFCGVFRSRTSRSIRSRSRVLRPGGRVQIADIVVGRPVGEDARGDPKLWAECVVWASLEEDYVELFRSVGFASAVILRRYDYFAGSASTDTRRVARSLGAMAVELRICK
jgi:hypothetical protein